MSSLALCVYVCAPYMSGVDLFAISIHVTEHVCKLSSSSRGSPSVGPHFGFPIRRRLVCIRRTPSHCLFLVATRARAASRQSTLATFTECGMAWQRGNASSRGLWIPLPGPGENIGQGCFVTEAELEDWGSCPSSIYMYTCTWASGSAYFFFIS